MVAVGTASPAGFPGETEEDHAATLALVEQYRFPHCHISQVRTATTPSAVYVWCRIVALLAGNVWASS